MTALDHTDLLRGPLSLAMRDGSRAEHTAAEGSAFMAALLDGRVDAEGYAAYLARLRTVYAALEDVGREHRDDPCVAAVVDPALARLPAIEDDLAFWGDPGELASPAATAYAERVRASAAWGGLFVAHHYTRYLGDLSGGRAIGRLLERQHGLGREGRGVQFYAFAQIPKPKLYKDAYRARLDALRLSPAETCCVLDEVKVAFALNRALFCELSEAI